MIVTFLPSHCAPPRSDRDGWSARSLCRSLGRIQPRINMRALIAWSMTCVLASCSSGLPVADEPQQRNASANSEIEFLIASAASDFQKQRPPHPVRFRNVRSGYVTTADGARQYRLCGEFLPASEDGKAEWTPFATIRTSPYEQWLGQSASGFCQDPAMTWDKRDLSSRLQTQWDSVRSQI